MFYVLLTKDNRVASVMETQLGEDAHMFVDNPDDYRSVIVQELDLDYHNDLADYRYDEEVGMIVYDPEDELTEYVDLETGETRQITSEEIDALVDEKVKNQVEAVLGEMLDNMKAENPGIATTDMASLLKGVM